jgi:carboxyl-terminal processing protease
MTRLLPTICAAFLVCAGAAVAAQERTSTPRGGNPYAPCTPIGRNLFVRDVLADLYFWSRFLPDVNPLKYPSPEAYLEAVRYRPLDSSFSAIVPKATYDALFSESQYVGFGFSTQTGSTAITVLQVFPGSSAADARLERGDRIVAVDGRSIASISASGALDSVFGPNTVGVTVVADIVSRSGEARRVTLRKTVVTIPPVSLTRTFLADGKVIGYINFRQFVAPSRAALDEAFAALRAAGATELILDLRYNGGGLLDVALHLANLIVDPGVRGQVFARIQHNDRNSRFDETLRFAPVPAPLGLQRLVAITSRASASASELIINGLRPYLPVTTVGERTFGKPVGQYGIEFCDRVLMAVAFAVVNARGEADYFSGIAADCPAADDTSRDLGAPDEASLAEAIVVIRTGGCSSAASSGRSLRRAANQLPLSGWDAVLNAQ